MNQTYKLILGNVALCLALYLFRLPTSHCGSFPWKHDLVALNTSFCRGHAKALEINAGTEPDTVINKQVIDYYLKNGLTKW